MRAPGKLGVNDEAQIARRGAGVKDKISSMKGGSGDALLLHQVD